MSAGITHAKVYFNGEFLFSNDVKFLPNNRAFQYGDGLFESIRIHQGIPIFIEDHLERLLAGMYALGLDSPFFDPVKVYNHTLQLSEENGVKEGRLRIHVFRNPGGFYLPHSDTGSMLMTIEPIEGELYQINERGLRLGLYSEIRKPVNLLSGIKSSSALLYVLAAREARQQGWDDALMLNEFGRICEATSSNIFLLMSDGKVLTPAVSEGILPGVFRKRLIQHLRDSGIEVEEGQVMHDDLYKAGEVWLTNSISGLRWAISWKERRYFGTTARKLSESLRAESERYVE